MKIIDILFGFLIVIGFILFMIGMIYLVYSSEKEIAKYKRYVDFCENRTDFCYCNLYKCEFKLLETEVYSNGILINQTKSNDTVELCNLAKELNDKEMIWKAC